MNKKCWFKYSIFFYDAFEFNSNTYFYTYVNTEQDDTRTHLTK